MNRSRLNIVVLGLSLASSQSGGQEMIYRGLIRELVARGHHVLFLEREHSCCCKIPDLALPPGGRRDSYSGLVELKDRFRLELRECDLVIVVSSIPDVTAVGEWVISVVKGATAFHDLEAPATLTKLKAGRIESLPYPLIPRFDLYLSSAGGPVLDYLKLRLGARAARPLYYAVDPEVLFPEVAKVNWDLGYSGIRDDGCQSQLERLMLEPASRCEQLRMVVAGSDYSQTMAWPANVELARNLNSAEARCFYNAQRFALNLTSQGKRAVGYSPSAGLFEAAACSTPIISDWWPGLETFFEPGREILIAHTPDDVLCYLCKMSEEERMMIGERGWVRVLTRHSITRRAIELEAYAYALLQQTACVGAGQ